MTGHVFVRVPEWHMVLRLSRSNSVLLYSLRAEAGVVPSRFFGFLAFWTSFLRLYSAKNEQNHAGKVGTLVPTRCG